MVEYNKEGYLICERMGEQAEKCGISELKTRQINTIGVIQVADLY